MSGSEYKWILTILVLMTPMTVSAKSWSADSLTVRGKMQVSNTSDPWFSPDKGLHLIGSTILTAGSALSLQRFGDYNRSRAVNLSIGFTFSLGVGKELFDSTKARNFFSYKDLAADFIGCCIGFMLVNLD